MKNRSRKNLKIFSDSNSTEDKNRLHRLKEIFWKLQRKCRNTVGNDTSMQQLTRHRLRLLIDFKKITTKIINMAQQGMK